ncbi:MAG: SDR family NAD(P)-dependent oxidoreductase [Acidimicrobiales bacterium]
MMRRFQDKLAVISGGLSGIGEACADRLADEGAEVVTLDLNDPANPVDVTDEGAVDGFFASLERAPDVVVNAAGTGGLTLVIDQSLEEWRRVLSVNLDGTFLCLRSAARRMVAEERGGSIVNISSINQDWVIQGFSAYCASKAGVRILTKAAALELGPMAIRVNAVAPGPVDTPLISVLHSIPEVHAEVARRTPLGHRWGRPSDISSVVAFLASDDGAWVTGQSITVDGGQTLVGEPDFLELVTALEPDLTTDAGEGAGD